MLSSLKFDYSISPSGRNFIKAYFQASCGCGVVGGIMQGFDLADRGGDEKMRKCAPCMTHEMHVYPVREGAHREEPMVFQVVAGSDWDFLRAFRQCAVKAAEGSLLVAEAYAKGWADQFEFAICTSSLFPKQVAKVEDVLEDVS